MQSAIICIIFGAAVIYIVRRVYMSMRHKEGGCPSCDPSLTERTKKR